ncbi:NusG domain II-containing protein [Dysosmobacter sp. Sow4_B12]|uniref:NusG domain II-containing protein n=1 Tax=Dysosmobacter sp. Sow4_B12 TaxID=3438777 RepID=UPI003F9279EE
MSTSPKLRPGIWDALVALTVAVLAVACAWTVWGGQDESGALTAVVSVDGVETERLALEEAERTIQAGGYTLRLRLTETEVWVESSDCPTQDCVHTGHISRSGQSIVCLPARVIVRLEGGETVDTGVDAVIG